VVGRLLSLLFRLIGFDATMIAASVGCDGI
jgi:hypothetical protein